MPSDSPAADGGDTGTNPHPASDDDDTGTDPHTDDTAPAVGRVASAFGRPGVVAVLAGLLVVAAAGTALALQRPAPADAEPPPFALGDAPAPTDGPYRTTGRLRATGDGETAVVQETRTFAPGDPPTALSVVTFAGDGEGVTAVAYRAGNRSWERVGHDDASEYRRQRDAADTETLVRADDAARTLYRFEREDHPEPGVQVGLALSSLAVLPFERTGTTTHEGRTVVRYVPETGWHAAETGLSESRTTVQVRSAEGELLVDPATGAVLFADVEATYVGAEHYGAALVADPVTLSVTYRVETGVAPPAEPPWVDGMNASAGPGENA